ncbi:MAG: hypothetical protein ACYSUH_10125 [Planctomycetota bacterium]
MRNFEQVKRIVIKIGTSTLSTDDGINRDYIQSLAQQVHGGQAVKDSRPRHRYGTAAGLRSDRTTPADARLP